LGTRRFQVLAATDSAASDDTGGSLTCYLLVTRLGTISGGWGDSPCTIPGLSVGVADLRP
jgi:hypothetical protein